jgi:hypothetical protein
VRIGIYNGREATAGAFANAMSISQAYGIVKNGLETSIVSYSTIDVTGALPNHYLDIDHRLIAETKSSEPVRALSEFDWVIWNSYRPEDDEILRSIRKNGVLVTKSFPRFFGNSESDNVKKLASRLDQFDFLAFGLERDALVAERLFSDNRRVGYIPRGFIVSLLKNQSQRDSFQICVDGPVRPNTVDRNTWKPEITIEELRHSLRNLKSRYVNLNLVSSRVNLGIEGSTRLKSLPMFEFYKQFFWNSDLYIGPPFSRSRQTENTFLGDGYSGVYENQVIEAQMCGASILGEQFSIAPELLSPYQSESTIDFRDVNAMTATIERVLKNSIDLRSQIAHWAATKHDSSRAMSLWIARLQGC